MSTRRQRPTVRKDPQMTSRPLARRGLLLGAGSLLTTGFLAACGSEPEPPPAPPQGPKASQPTPQNTTEQLTTVVSEVNADVMAADKAKKSKELAPRVSGSAVHFRQAAYESISTSKGLAKFLDVPGATLTVPLTTVTAGFPRVSIALVEDDETEGLRHFVALQQADAHSPYTSWGWAKQLSGVEMPSVSDARVGAENVATDADGLLMTPAEALELYAKTLTDGAKGDPDQQIAEDPFKTSRHEQIQAERTQLNEGVEKDEAATIRETYAVHDEEFAGLRTDDGGALVMGTMRSSRKMTVQDGATVRYEEDAYTKVAGTHEFTEEFVRSFGIHVALYIPPKDADAPIQPIGASLTILGATAE
ncbi:hypothetical protein [Brachybacterium sacelli]|uniref:DUF8094 domain-containing protein n=1 Tax=Brachybacterium sacelli TaxID=173364 RepID=A0ABS4X615_9MICO|nr:hypothetical protein [Brachybacterium sacelli]MBP2383875.1 hypothetical protein [Brachybacterium sacelli]